MSKVKKQKAAIQRAAPPSSTPSYAGSRPARRRDAWTAILDALAELGRAELERRKVAEREQADTAQEQGQ